MNTNLLLFFEWQIKITGNIGDLPTFNDICNLNLANSDGKRKTYHGPVPFLPCVWIGRFHSKQ